jgi:hypothetical protein
MPFLVLTIVHSLDVLSYLMALKSFARFANPKRIVIVCDQSVTSADRDVSLSHIPHVELHNAAAFVYANLPRGGCWERLYAITEYSPTEYVVQLDADTVTISNPSSVLRAIERNSGFVLGEEAGQNLLSTVTTDSKSHRPDSYRRPYPNHRGSVHAGRTVTRRCSVRPRMCRIHWIPYPQICEHSCWNFLR